MNVYILSAKRTPIGSFMGGLSSIPAPRLAVPVIKALVTSGSQQDEVKSVSVEDVQECIMGQVLTAGSGQAPARQSALYAGLKVSTQCMTINKVCGSGLKAIMLAQDSILCGRHDVVVAGGQENMSLSPYIVPHMRTGFKLGSFELEDSLIKDGLWDPYNNFHMGNAGEICAQEYKVSREEQDSFAISSYKKAKKAQENNCFKAELIPITVEKGKEQCIISKDEEPDRVIYEKIQKLKPVFKKEGSITAANASKINDGASVCTVVSENYIKSEKKKPLAQIIASGAFAQQPEFFTIAPVSAIKNCLKNAGLKITDIDLFEINEAFSVVTLAVAKELSIPMEKLNVHGGAVALGHPLGASGARILTTLIHALHKYNKRYGMVGICLGGGEALALLVEKC